MATLAALKKQLAALEARVAKATQAEMGNAIAKVRKLMSEFGLTIEHLAGDAVRSRRVSKKSATPNATQRSAALKVPAKAKGSKAPKYVDPTSGATWSGVGRAPRWIADAKNRDVFLIEKSAASAPARTPKAVKKATKPIASVKQAMAAAAEKKAARKSPARKKANAPEVEQAPTAAKKAASRTAVAKKTPAKKASAKKGPSKAPANKAVSKKAAATAESTAPTRSESAGA